MTKLLTDNDPAPYISFNESGKKNLILLCDHASYQIPEKLGDLGLKPEELALHIACDYGALDVTRRLSERMDAVGFATNFSRLIIDCNRRPNTIPSIPSVSDEVIVPGNLALTRLDIQQRVTEIFDPYHNTIDAHIGRIMSEGHIPALISIHSFTDHFNCMKRPWHIGVLWNYDPRMAVPLIDELYKDSNLCIGDNEPYSGREEYGYTIDVHAFSKGLPHVLIEIRQDLINTVEKAYYWADLLYEGLNKICANEELYKQEFYG